MTLAIDSLVTDLMFQPGDALDPEILVEVLGGEETLATKQVVDPDTQDPRFEMEVSPSVPFRQRGERRLMIIDDSVAPMRKAPREDTVIALDLREAQTKLIEVCKATPVRLGRLFALGSWGDAVWVSRTYRDLRALCLMSWALDPNLDVDGRQRANPLGKKEFEEKLLAYDKRLDELNDTQIQACLEGATVTEEDDLIVVSMLEEDGTWNTLKSLEIEHKVAALETFSTFPGAKYIPTKKNSVEKDSVGTEKQHSADSEEENLEQSPKIELTSEPLQILSIGDEILIYFPMERFSLDVAAQLGKKDWAAIIRSEDGFRGEERDKLMRSGANFITGIEFFSEVFVEDAPLSKAVFEKQSTKTTAGTRSIEAHFPRFGPVLFIQRDDGARFVTSRTQGVENLEQTL